MHTQQAIEDTPIFYCDCPEPKGTIRRYVYPMILTPQNLKRFWDLSSKFKTLLGNGVDGDFKKFAEIFISMDNDKLMANGLLWRIDDFVGVFYMTHIGSSDAQIHYSFFDQRHRGRQAITRKMIKYVFQKYGFRRLSAEIPLFAKATYPFVKEVGLVPEGRKRKAALYDNEWFDVQLFGVLQEEAQSWE